MKKLYYKKLYTPVCLMYACMCVMVIVCPIIENYKIYFFIHSRSKTLSKSGLTQRGF